MNIPLKTMDKNKRVSSNRCSNIVFSSLSYCPKKVLLFFGDSLYLMSAPSRVSDTGYPPVRGVETIFMCPEVCRARPALCPAACYLIIHLYPIMLLLPVDGELIYISAPVVLSILTRQVEISNHLNKRAPI